MFVQNFHAREWSQAGRSLYRQSHKIEAISKGGGKGDVTSEKKKLKICQKEKKKYTTKGNKGGLAS